MLRKPQEAVACSGVHPSLSPRFTSAPWLTKNSTMSRLSSMQAWKRDVKRLKNEQWRILFSKHIILSCILYVIIFENLVSRSSFERIVNIFSLHLFVFRNSTKTAQILHCKVELCPPLTFKYPQNTVLSIFISYILRKHHSNIMASNENYSIGANF